tara:strand:+ start:64 stop:321 length:258 start_codon:yes stop_codon:yes gene_type:complete
MATAQQQYDDTKNRLDNNIKRLQLLNTEISQKKEEYADAIAKVNEIISLENEAKQLTQPILEDQGAIKVLSETDGVISAEVVESK